MSGVLVRENGDTEGTWGEGVNTEAETRLRAPTRSGLRVRHQELEAAAGAGSLPEPLEGARPV